MPLRLKSLELQGYKTFATRTLFEFASGITAIVGPNGSGKSNIADAMRWVLGEQSYTLLRGKKTEDMIFSGSEHRPRSGMAHASVTFDNTDTWLPVDFAEVSLSRHAFRDGRNDYLLNGQHVRLRDINELLSQAGLSERTYTILGQGLVDASLALKADERRRLFEEAAGVALYRSRREDALKRLEHTERNLERVLDILSELEPRLRSLERQAKRAIDYGRAQADLRATLRDWYGYHWHSGQARLTEAREKVRQQEKRVQEASQAFQSAQADYAGFRERLSGLRGELNAWHRQSAELHSQRERISRDLAVVEERRRALNTAHTAMLFDLEAVSDQEKLLHERMLEVDGETTRQQVERDEAHSELNTAQQALQSGQLERAALEAQLTGLRTQLETINQQRAEIQARLDELESRFEGSLQKLESARQTFKSAEAAMLNAEAVSRDSQGESQNAEAEWRKAETKLGDRKQQLERLETERRVLLEKNARGEADFSRLKAQLEVLEQAEITLSGYADGARFLLDAARNAQLRTTRGALSAVLDVPAELEIAIAAALGDTLDAVLLEDGELDEALRLLESDEAGRAALLPLLGTSNHPLSVPRDDDCLGLASDLVKVPDDLRSALQLILGHTLIAKNRASARRLMKGLPLHARVVSLRGEVFRGDGLVIAGKTAAVSTLSRPRQKRELATSLEDLTARIKESKSAADRLSAQLLAAHEEATQAAGELEAARLKLEKSHQAEHQAGLESESARRQLDWHNSQVQELESGQTEAEANRKKWVAAQAEIEVQSSRIAEQIKGLSARLSESSLEEIKSQVTYWSTRLEVIEQGMQNVKARKEERSEENLRLESRKSDLTEKMQKLETELVGLDGEQAGLHETETSYNQQIEELQLKMGPAETDLENAEAQEAKHQTGELTAQRAMAAAERMLNQIQLELSRRQDNLNSLREKILDDFGLVEFDYAEEVTGPQPLPFEGLVEQLPLVNELPLDLEQTLTTQKSRLRRLGPVNPEARQEFESESERYSFLKTQVDDLNKAEADLKKVITELDELMRRDFLKTFEMVDKEFRQSFVRLFGGGSARLSLTDPDNIVETGIEIEARLPGRREQGLALLSGGERSLTAIALVFALLKVSPTPVCVMDEVDAMLDEANVGRFRDLLAELSKETQFIIITHNRNTVQAADVIYGVTMGRDSASQVISLRLDEVTDDILMKG